jgi:D-serine deaminase-like pyridoxal phosphate-dependent protein
MTTSFSLRKVDCITLIHLRDNLTTVMTTTLELDTPFIAADVDTVKKNISNMQKIADENGKKLRPHIKTHKLPLLAQWQMEAGAVGICVQKTAEAEIMAQHGLKNILVSNEIIGSEKTDRLAQLALYTRLSVAVDSELGVNQLSESAAKLGAEIGVFLDIDVGMNRCGIKAEEASRLAELVSKSANLHLEGVMGYDGHSAKVADPNERTKAVMNSYRSVQEALRQIKSKGLVVETVSVGGSPSSYIWAKLEGITELQPGTYIYNDAHQVLVGVAKKESCAVQLFATVMSKPNSRKAVVDAGSKSFGFDQGKFPMPVRDINGEFTSFSEEHGVIQSKNSDLDLSLGEKLSFIPYHICVTTDLWDYIYFCKGEKVLTKMRIEARGART